MPCKLHILTFRTCESVTADLRVERALQRRVFVLVDDAGARAVLQQHPDDALVAPAGRHVQGCVAFIVLQVQMARLDVVVHQRLHTLSHTDSLMANAASHAESQVTKLVTEAQTQKVKTF